MTELHVFRGGWVHRIQDMAEIRLCKPARPSGWQKPIRGQRAAEMQALTDLFKTAI